MATAAVAMLSAGFAGTARAQGEPPEPGASSVSQYVELIPTAVGPKAPGVGKERRTPLSPKAKRALDDTSRSTAHALANIATSSSYGAPPKPPRGASTRALRDTRSPDQATSLDRTLQALTAAAAPVGDFRMIGLLLALVAVTVGGAALAVRKRFWV